MLPAPFTMAEVAEQLALGSQVIETRIHIARPPSIVFDFVTCATKWHHWHPATRRVMNTPDRPLILDDTVQEDIAAAGRRFSAVWKVFECEPYRRWQIATITKPGSSLLTYELVERDGGCDFYRRVEYRSNGWLMRVALGRAVRRTLERQSLVALSNLKHYLEKNPAWLIA